MLICICGKMGSGKSFLLNTISYDTYKIDDFISSLHLKFKDDIYKIFQTNEKKEIFGQILQDKFLENKLFLLFKSDIIRFLQQLKNQAVNQKIIVEFANVYQYNLESYFDEIIYIVADENFCYEDSLKRNKQNGYMINEILKKQILENNFSNHENILYKNYPNHNTLNFKNLIDKL